MQVTSCSGVNTGIVDAFLEKWGLEESVMDRGNVVALFVGHDHPNDFSVDYRGLYMAYGRKSGYGGYGIPGHIRKGARVLRIKENPFSFDTYIAGEDLKREWLVNMHWTNGTQYYCNAGFCVYYKNENDDDVDTMNPLEEYSFGFSILPLSLSLHSPHERLILLHDPCLLL